MAEIFEIAYKSTYKLEEEEVISVRKLKSNKDKAIKFMLFLKQVLESLN